MFKIKIELKIVVQLIVLDGVVLNNIKQNWSLFFFFRRKMVTHFVIIFYYYYLRFGLGRDQMDDVK